MIQEEIKRLIKESPVKQNRIAQRSGVTESAISHFMARNGALRLGTAEKILGAIGYAITIIKRKNNQEPIYCAQCHQEITGHSQKCGKGGKTVYFCDRCVRLSEEYNPDD